MEKNGGDGKYQQYIRNAFIRNNEEEEEEHVNRRRKKNRCRMLQPIPRTVRPSVKEKLSHKS